MSNEPAFESGHVENEPAEVSEVDILKGQILKLQESLHNQKRETVMANANVSQLQLQILDLTRPVTTVAETE